MSQPSSPGSTPHSPALEQPLLPQNEHNVPGALDEPPSPSLPEQPTGATLETARQERLAALERRLGRARSPSTPDESSIAVVTQDPLPFDHNYVKRIEFRRLIDPGILRPNSTEVALRSLRTLSTIADNLLREPENPKFRQFKPTNSIIKRDLVNPKGTLEYAVAMGFRPEVADFQPYYSFNKKHLADLEIGAAILHEMIEIESSKHGGEELKLKIAKEEEEDRIHRAKQAFLDDRKTQMLRAERERVQRAHEAQRKNAQSPPGHSTNLD